MAWVLLAMLGAGIGYAALCALYADLGASKYVRMDSRAIRRHEAGRRRQAMEYAAKCEGGCKHAPPDNP